MGKKIKHPEDARGDALRKKYFDMFADFLNPWLARRDIQCKMWYDGGGYELILNFVDRNNQLEYLTFDISEIEEDFTWAKWRRIRKYIKAFLNLYLDTRRNLPPWIPSLS